MEFLLRRAAGIGSEGPPVIGSRRGTWPEKSRFVRIAADQNCDGCLSALREDPARLLGNYPPVDDRVPSNRWIATPCLHHRFGRNVAQSTQNSGSVGNV